MNAQTFLEFLDDCGYETRRYSGRGMYGKKCPAVTTDESEIEFAVNVMLASFEKDDTEGIGAKTD